MTTSKNFAWAKFYMEFADKLLGYKENRKELLRLLFEIEGLSDLLMDKKEKEGEKVPLEDICPFTVFALFNNNATGKEKSLEIAAEIANAIGVKEKAPNSIEGIPRVIYNKFFFAFAFDRGPDDIDTLWNLFTIALHYADNNTAKDRDDFIKAFGKTFRVKQVAIRKLSMGIFWIRPEFFYSFDSKSSKYIEEILYIKAVCDTAEDYIDLREDLIDKLRDPECPVQSFQELALKALTLEVPPPKLKVLLAGMIVLLQWTK